MPLNRNNALQGLQEAPMDFYEAADLGDQDAIERGGLPAVGTISPQWSRYFGGLTHLAGGKEQKFAGGPSAPGSNQLRGYSTQPAPVQSPFIGPYSGGPFGQDKSQDPNFRTQSVIAGLKGYR